MISTALRCDCHQVEVLAVGRPERSAIEVHDRRHGTTHMVELTLTEMVRMLDPNGTSYRPVK